MVMTQLLADRPGVHRDSIAIATVPYFPPANEQIQLDDALFQFANSASHRSFHTGRYRCHYSAWGSGPPLVLVHGLADVPRSFVLPMSILSRHFRCIAYSLPDGRTDGACLMRYRHSDLVNDLFALLDHLNIQKTFLFGSSFGSTIALAAMHAQPARVSRAVLQGGFARRPLLLFERLLAKFARHWPAQMRRFPFRRLLLLYKQNGPFAGRPPEVREHLLDCTGQASIRAVMRRALMMDALDLRAILPKIRRPILMICGAEDHLVGKEREAELLVGLPRAKRAEIPGCGHFPYYTHPELLADFVARFLSPRAASKATRRRKHRAAAWTITTPPAATPAYLAE